MTTNQNAQDFSDIDGLLDATLDDLADMPEFKPFPAGAHRVNVSFEKMKVNDISSISMNLVAIETVELANPEDTPVVAKDSTNVLFMLKKKDGSNNDLAQGQLKGILKPLQEHFKSASNSATMEDAKGAECLVVTKIRTDKRDKDNIKHYTEVVSLQVM